MPDKSIWILFYTPLSNQNIIQILGAYTTKELALKRAQQIKNDFWIIEEMPVEEEEC